MNIALKAREAAPVRGRFLNAGGAPSLQAFDIGHADYAAAIDADAAFWALVPKPRLPGILLGEERLEALEINRPRLIEEMRQLRFGLKPSAVYVNPTERCNLNCSYCYIPEGMRREGAHMSQEKLLDALARLKAYFAQTMPEGRKPQIIFHGAEPLLNKDALFAAIDAYGGDFRFGVQTNATLLDGKAAQFLMEWGCSLGLSLDAPQPELARQTRARWTGEGVFDSTLAAMERLKGYQGWSVICTMTEGNLDHLVEMVDFLHERHVPTCMLNVIRCTQPGARTIRPEDGRQAQAFMAALDRTHELYQQTGRKMVVANFANILIGILAPTARRLMCDISPCGGGRSFFALAPNGDLFPCSEFIGIERFAGGNLFAEGGIETALESAAFREVTGRKVEDIGPCAACAIRHFCGSPCPAEAAEMNGGMQKIGAFCHFFVEQTRYAFRKIADGQAKDYLWDGWDEGTETLLALGQA